MGPNVKELKEHCFGDSRVKHCEDEEAGLEAGIEEAQRNRKSHLLADLH
jgi:hypothetical protein